MKNIEIVKQETVKSEIVVNGSYTEATAIVKPGTTEAEFDQLMSDLKIDVLVF